MSSSPRCSTPGCAVRFRTGTDRPCAMHTDDPSDSMLGRMSALLAAAPGEPDSADGEGEPEGSEGQ